MSAYYNEFDPVAAAWLRELIKRGLIADGEVDERSIIDVSADELRGFTQCHFFAGIGGWSYALRLAGWPDDKPVWTGSPPCQPFSSAGKQLGKDDARHLSPHFISLVRSARPAMLFGEQVASADVFGKSSGKSGKGIATAPEWAWIDDLSDRLEAARYAVGASDIPAAFVGSPHIRQRTFFGAVRLADASNEGLEGAGGASLQERWRDGYVISGRNGGLANDAHIGCIKMRECGSSQERDGDLDTAPLYTSTSREIDCPWGDPDWLYCRDGKWRPVEASSQPMADGLPEGMGRVRDPRPAETEREINRYAEATQTRPEEVLRDLCDALAAQASCERTAGGVEGLLPPSLLLAFVCQLAAQGWNLAQSLPLSRSQEPSRGMRMLWGHEAATSAPCKRGLVGQQAGEPSDIVHILSPFLARDAQEAWGEAILADAEIGFPLGHNIPARVGRLRGYGNAIVPQAAAEFIRAFIESTKGVVTNDR